MPTAERRRLNVMETRWLKSMCGVTRMDCIRNEEIQRRTKVVRGLVAQT